MKGVFFSALIMIFCMLLLPLTAVKTRETEAAVVQTAAVLKNHDLTEQNYGFEKIKVLKDGNIIEFSAVDYVFGVVAAEMPALYNTEALKSQAVAAYTFACYRIKNNAEDLEYDITANPETDQCFITRSEAAEKWGESAAEYESKIDACISEVAGQILTYDGEPVFAAYHAISSGVTNACSDVFGEDLPYLQPTDSSFDILAEKYLSESTFTAEELNQKLGVTHLTNESIKNCFSNITSTDNGYVKSLNLGDKSFTGSQVCKALGLRSCNFEITYGENSVTFKVKGYGHGVGMSQNGADYMANCGSNYAEILSHYYKGTVLQKNN